MKTSIVQDQEKDYARLSCRVQTRIKKSVEQAASLLGQSITDFTEAALAEKAQSVLERHTRITLTERDFTRFVELVENPPPPTAALRAAMADYQRQMAVPTDSTP